MIVDHQSQQHIGGWEEYPKHNFDDHLATDPWWNCWLAIIKTLEKGHAHSTQIHTNTINILIMAQQNELLYFVV